MAREERILLVEDEDGLVMSLSDRLVSEGYLCEARTDGLAGTKAAITESYDAIVLDVMLPGKSGFDVCSDVRSAGVMTPILMLTARNQLDDRVLGLKLGADDYLCKPFEMCELLARLEALIRRSQGIPFGMDPALAAENRRAWERIASRGKVTYGAFSVDFAKGNVERDGQLVSLSGQEYKLFAFLSDHPREIFSRERLLDAVWGYGCEVSTRTVDVHIAWLRRKIGDIEPIPRHILTVRGLGYKFEP